MFLKKICHCFSKSSLQVSTELTTYIPLYSIKTHTDITLILPTELKNSTGETFLGNEIMAESTGGEITQYLLHRLGKGGKKI